MMSCNVFRFFVGNAEIAKKKKKGGGNGRVWVVPTWVIVFSPSSCSVIIFRWLQLREILIMPNCFQLFGFFFFFLVWFQCVFAHALRSAIVYAYMYIYILAIYSSRSCHRLDHHYHVPLSLALAPLALSIAPFHLRISLPWRLLLSECYFWNAIYSTTFGIGPKSFRTAHNIGKYFPFWKVA